MDPVRVPGFEVGELLGEGAQGTVWRARDAAQREVALKVLHADAAQDPEQAGRFLREGRIACALQHPNVVRAYAAGEAEGRLWVSCELVTGGSLKDRLRREGRLRGEALRPLLLDLLRGLEAIHMAGLVHRDLKPANVLLSARGVAQIADLGLARSVSAARTRYTRTGVILGSPAYMSPEQIDSGELDARTDLYSLGALLYECLTGTAPFPRPTVLEILRAHLDDPAPDPRARAEVSDDLAQLVLALLEKSPERRPPSAAEALARLEGRADVFPGTLDSSSAGDVFPGTLDSPSSSDAFPGTLDGPSSSDAFPGTLDGPSSGDVFPATLEAPAASELVFAETEAAPPPPQVLRPHVESAARGLRRAKLRLGGATLFVYAGRRMVLGRLGLDHGDHEVCLRVLPGASNAEASRRISGRHLAFDVNEGRIDVTDLQSSGGTWVEGRRLSPRVPRALAGPLRVDVAQVLELEARPIPAPAGPEVALDPARTTVPSPALHLVRTQNAPEQGYLLLPGRCALGVAAGALQPGLAGVELLDLAGELWLRDGETLLALVEGLAFQLGAERVSVSSIHPSDQK